MGWSRDSDTIILSCILGASSRYCVQRRRVCLVRTCACVCVCVYVCARVCVRARACVCLRVCGVYEAGALARWSRSSLMFRLASTLKPLSLFAPDSVLQPIYSSSCSQQPGSRLGTLSACTTDTDSASGAAGAL